MSSLPERAEALARAAHAGQQDKVGADYILHPARVAARTAEIAPAEIRKCAAAAAWLHDTVEDTDVTLEALRAQGFPAAVVDAVDRLTRREEVADEEYFARLRASEIARIVKVADLIDNTSPERSAQLDPVTRARLQEKYVQSWQLLLGEVQVAAET